MEKEKVPLWIYTSCFEKQSRAKVDTPAVTHSLSVPILAISDNQQSDDECINNVTPRTKH